MAFRRLRRKKDKEELEELVEEEVMIEEADDEYVLLKAFTSKNPEVAFSYAINRIDELKVDVSSLSKEKESLEKLNTALQDDIEDAFRFKEQFDDLNAELIEKERELSDKAVEIDTLVRKSAKLAVERDEMKDNIAKKGKQIQGYMTQMEKLKHSDRLIRLEKDNKLKESKLADLEEEAKTLRIQNGEMKDSLSVIDEELNQYKQMAITHDEELNTLKTNWWDANTQAKDLKRQLEEKVSILASKEEMIKNMMFKSKKINLEFGAIDKELKEKREALADFEKEKEEKDLKIKELEEKVTEAIEKGPKLQEAQRRIEELLPLEDEVKKLRISLEEQKDALNVATSEVDQYRGKAITQDEELDTLKANWWDANTQVNNLKEEIQLKEGIIADKDATLNELIEKSRGTAAELDMLKKQMAESAVMGSGAAAEPATPPPEAAPPASEPSPEPAPETPTPTTQEAPAPAAPEPTPEPAAPAPEPTPASPEPAPVEEPVVPKVEEPALTPEPTPAPEAAPQIEEPVPEPAAEPAAPQVNPNASKIKLLEIERRSLLKMLANPKIQGGPLKKKYIEKLDEINKKVSELRV